MAGLSELARLLASNPQSGSPLQNSLAPQRTILGALSPTIAPTEAPQVFPCFECYLDSAIEWRWRYRASNYKTIADSGEGYKNYEDMLHAIGLMRGCMNASIYVKRD
jgi:uncharacterized protein YegP (UPF0339 family)